MQSRLLLEHLSLPLHLCQALPMKQSWFLLSVSVLCATYRGRLVISTTFCNLPSWQLANFDGYLDNTTIYILKEAKSNWIFAFSNHKNKNQRVSLVQKYLRRWLRKLFTQTQWDNQQQCQNGVLAENINRTVFNQFSRRLYRHSLVITRYRK